MKDRKYYSSVLGVRENATAKDVRRAYRRLALERHPDKHNNSTQSKEDFQLLHEAYEYLLSGAAPVETSVDHEAPTSPGFRATVVRRESRPGISRAPANGRAALKMWLNAMIVGFVVLGASIAWELAERNSVSPAKAPHRDLASHSWCLISKAGTDSANEAFEYWTEATCKQKCETLAQKSDVSCSWNSELFHGIAKPAPKEAPMVKTALPDVSCQITMERQEARTETTPYLQQTEASCMVTCLSKADLEPRAGIRCVASGKEVFRRERYAPPPETDAETSAAMAAYNHSTMKEAHPNAPDSASVDLHNTCYLTALSPGNIIQDQFPGDTAKNCEARCRYIIMQNPLESEVRCAFAGKELVTYVPDGTAAYLAHNPGAAPGGMRQGADTVNNCEIYTAVAGSRTKAYAQLQSVRDCDDRCHDEFKKAVRGSTINCTHAGKEFFRQDAP